jgi:hypothetical protein
LTRLANVRGRLELEFVGREADHTDADERLGGSRMKIMAHACDQIPPSAHGAAGEQFEIGRFGVTLELLAFASKPEAIHVAAGPAERLPRESGARIGIAQLEPIEAEENVCTHIMSGMAAAQHRKRSGTIGVRQRRNGFTRDVGRHLMAHGGVIV